MSAPSKPSITLNHKKRRSSHHRSRSGRIRRKNLWSQFSRWDAETCDDGSDIFDVCHSRGLIRSSSIPSKIENSTKTNNDKKTAATSRQISEKLTENIKDKKKYSKFISLLCSFLCDKEKFLRDSFPEPASSSCSNSNKLHGGKAPTGSAENMTVAKPAVDEEEGSTPKIEKMETVKAKLDNAPKLCSAFFRQKIEKKHSVPKILFRSEELKPNSQDKNEITNDTTAVSKSSESALSSHRKTCRQWNADVELDIMRLYENAVPEVRLSALYNQQSSPQRWSTVKEQVDKKLSNAEQTPSYVLALANLFRKHTQIRKEFSQVANQVQNVDVKNAPYWPIQSSLNGFQQQYPRNFLAKTNKDCSSVAFRYHHVTKGCGVYINEHHPPINQKSCSAIRGTALSHSTVTPRKPVSVILENAEYKDHNRSSEPTNKLLSLSGTAKEQEKLNALFSFSRNVSASEKETLSKLESLEELLTVFRKTPHLKFAGIQQSPNHGQDSISYKSKTRCSHKLSSLDHFPFSESHQPLQHFVNDLITPSVVSTDRKNTNNQPIQDKAFRKQGARKMTSPQSCPNHSGAQTIQKNNKRLNVAGHSSAPLISNNRGLHENSASSSSTSNLFSFDQPKTSDEISFPIIPESKLRWPESLGSLYKKSSAEFTESKNPIQKFGLDLTSLYPDAFSSPVGLPKQDDQNIYFNPDVTALS